MVKVLRWVCDKCNKKWIHPIDTCLYCMGKTKKQVGYKTKVVGATKVSIPNPLHPIIPYNVLMLEDEHGNKMPKKTMKDYNLGDIYEDISDSSDKAISAIKIKYDYFEAVKEALELIGDIKVDSNTKILIKPNLGVPGYAYLGVCTNPKVLEALIQYLLEKGAKKENIAAAEQSFFLPNDKAISKSGTPEILNQYGINFIDIAKTEFDTVQYREFNFKISRIVKEYDMIFNLPVIKTDMYLGVDASFENLIRFLNKETFADLAKDQKKAALALAALPFVLPKFITLSDASIGMQGNGPADYGEPGFYNMIFASRNPVVHDTAIAEVFCLRKLPYVELAGKLGLGEYDIRKIKFIGNEFDAIRRDIKQPIGSKLIKKGSEE